MTGPGPPRPASTVGRPVDRRRRAMLLDAAVDHAVAHGFAELTWRSVAAALGVSTSTLVHHFGSREQLLALILVRTRERVGAVTAGVAGPHPDLPTAARAVWTASASPRHGPSFRLFFAVYGHALQVPDRFTEFLASVGVELTEMLCAAQGPDVDPDVARVRATLVIATVRGLLLDLLGGGDRARVEAAAQSFLDGLA